MCCPLVFEFSVGIGGFLIGLGQISFFFSFMCDVYRTKVGQGIYTYFLFNELSLF